MISEIQVAMNNTAVLIKSCLGLERFALSVVLLVTLPLFLDPVHSDGKLEIVVPSFVHYLEVLEGSDGEKLAGIVCSILGHVTNTGLDVMQKQSTSTVVGF